MKANTGRFARRAPVVQCALDLAIWLLAPPAGALLRFDFRVSSVSGTDLLAFMIVAAVAHTIIGVATGLYRRRWRYGSFEELPALAATVVSTGIVLSTILVFRAVSLPRSIPILSMGMTLVGAVAVRTAWRLLRDRRRPSAVTEPILIIGAGSGGYHMVRMMSADSGAAYRPVAIVDDDPLKANLRIQGVRVEGSIDDTPAVAAKFGTTTALLAIPSGDIDLIRRVNEIATGAGLNLLVLPPVKEMFGTPGVLDIRPVRPQDFLGRPPAKIDPEAIAGYITGRRVLITGAGGSIGSELCRQLARFEPSELMMLDRDESGLHAVQLSLEGRVLLESPNLLLADIRDENRLHQIFMARRPEVVLHAAALKHLTLVEAAPTEAWLTNVVGTRNVLAAAEAAGVGRLINISADKAAAPTSVLGSTQRIAERMTSDAATRRSAAYLSVRFGNVLGSRGSVLSAFRAQAEMGGPITVTHPDVTRFFITVEEAVRLTIHGGALEASGEALVLDMGTPLRITDVAAAVRSPAHSAAGHRVHGVAPRREASRGAPLSRRGRARRDQSAHHARRGRSTLLRVCVA